MPVPLEIIEIEDSWFTRAVNRRVAEENGEIEVMGARFNSYI